MKFKNCLVGGLLTLSTTAKADSTWPSINDELEEIMYQVKGFQNRGFGGTVIPCSSQSSGPGRQNAAEWLRTGFHDMSTRNIFTGKGGLDGSLQYEVSRGENTGPGFKTTLTFMSNYYTSRSSVADLIALGVYYSVRSCGGHPIPVRGGRIDATAAGDIGVPQPQNSLYSFQQRFLGMGFDNTEMVQMIACGHTLGGVHVTEFPDIAPENSPDGEAGLDSTVAAFDNKVITEYLTNTTTNPLVVGQSTTNGRNSDARVFASDQNATVKAMADSTAFQSVCQTILQKMIDAVPPSVTLTDPIAPYFVKPVGLHLTLETGATMMTLGGSIRVRTTTLSTAPSSVTIVYRDRNGGSNCRLSGCSYTVTQQGISSGFDDTFAWYQFGSGFGISTSAGISSFTITLNFADGTKQTFDNNGAAYPLQDGILLQKPQSCLLQTTGALTVTAAVRNDRNSLPVNLSVSQKSKSDSNPVATLNTLTTAMTKGICVGPYTFYTASYQIPDASLSYSAKIDVVSGTGSGVMKDDFITGTDLGGSCDSFSAPPTSMCTTGSVDTTSGVSSTIFSSVNSTTSSPVSSAITSSISRTPITSSSLNVASSTIPISASSTTSSTKTAATPSHKQSIGGYKLVGCKAEGAGSRALGAAAYAYDGMTLDKCMSNCAGYSYWGTEYGRECDCGDSIGSGSSDAPLAECNMVCSGDSTEYCGAGNRIEVYMTTATPTVTLGFKATVSPYTRVGCYTEVSGRALTGAAFGDDAMSLEMCASKCASFSYFGAEYGRECYCGNTLDAQSTKAADGDCNMVCAGNKYEYCGGSNRMELYSLEASSAPTSALVTAVSSTSSAATSSKLSTSTSTSSQTSTTVASASSTHSGTSQTSNSLATSSTPSSSTIHSSTGSSVQTLGSSSTSISLSSTSVITYTRSINSSPTISSSSSTTSTSSLRHLPTVSSYMLVGCWTEGSGARALSAKSTSSSDSMTLESCASFCSAYHYFGTEYGGECYCGNSLASSSTNASLSDCSMPCTGNAHQYCGAGSRLELYYSNTTNGPSQPATVGGDKEWTWEGCRTEAQGVRALAGKATSADDMSLEKCAETCQGFKYFGTEYGGECYCGDRFGEGSKETDAGECSMTCGGNAKEFCGAGGRLSVYASVS
ncbi:putative WSC domain-containing protein [Seiridium unicorne]|uniref:WSC domain-containing protein n=1 Tax=Seiridium unicorne TaxID=138068 RepID=A0ABR2VHV2_9PEZI